MGKRPDTWMPFFVGDYLGDTMHLTRDQHGGYMLLIFAYWRNGAPLLDDNGLLGAIVKATPGEWRKLRPILAPFFTLSDGRWHHKRIDAEIEKAQQRTDERRKAGAEGAAKRWQSHDKGGGKTIAKPSPSHKQTDGKSQVTITPSPDGEGARAQDPPPVFEITPELLAEAAAEREKAGKRKTNLYAEKRTYELKTPPEKRSREGWLAWAIKAWTVGHEEEEAAAESVVQVASPAPLEPSRLGHFNDCDCPNCSRWTQQNLSDAAE